MIEYYTQKKCWLTGGPLCTLVSKHILKVKY